MLNIRYLLFIFAFSCLHTANAQYLNMHDFMAILTFEVEVDEIGEKLEGMGFIQSVRKGEIMDTISWTRDCRDIHEPSWTITDVRSQNASAVRLVYDHVDGMAWSLHMAVIGEERAKTLTQELKTMGFKKSPILQEHVWEFRKDGGWRINVWEDDEIYSFRFVH